MRDAAFVKACSLIERFRKESQHWRKLVYQVSDEQSAANKALTDIAKHCGLKAWTIPQLVESVGLALAERDSLAGTYSLMQRDHEDGFKEAVGVLGDPAALQEALSKMTKERDAQSALVAKQRHLLAAKQTEIGALEAERDEMKEEIKQANKEASDATARQRMTEARALNYSLQADEARREIERLRVEAFDPDAVRALQDERDALKRDVERLQGIKPELPPRDGRGEGLPRYGLRWNGPDQPVATPMEDGFWVPWHLAQKEVEALRRKCGLDGEKLEALGMMYENVQREVESLRAKLASRTVEWPEWAKVGAAVRSSGPRASWVTIEMLSAFKAMVRRKAKDNNTRWARRLYQPVTRSMASLK